MNWNEEMVAEEAARVARTKKLIVLAVAGTVAVMGLLVFRPFKIVSAGNVGVQVTLGSVNQTPMGEGIHLINPVSSVHEINVRANKTAHASMSASKDLQQVKTEITINYHVNDRLAPLFYQKLPKNYEEVIVGPAVAEVTKAVMAQYTAEELITKRSDISDKVRVALVHRIQTKSYGSLSVDDVNMTDFAFSRSFAEAVEAKQEAAQRAEKAKNDLARVTVEGQQRVAQARAEAEALNLQKEAVTSQLLELKRLENERAGIAKWNGVLPTTTGGAVPFVNVGK